MVVNYRALTEENVGTLPGCMVAYSLRGRRLGGRECAPIPIPFPFESLPRKLGGLRQVIAHGDSTVQTEKQ